MRKIYYDLWYLMSWVGLVEANLITITFWPRTLVIIYFFISSLILTWVHEYWWENRSSVTKVNKDEI